jgi:hypothetical protein
MATAHHPLPAAEHTSLEPRVATLPEFNRGIGTLSPLARRRSAREWKRQITPTPMKGVQGMAKTAETTRQEQTPEQQAAETEAHEAAGLHLHTRTLHPPIMVPYLTRDDVASTARAATSRLPGVPAGKDLVFYGGLGAMAVAGALEWPVALAVGGATWLLRGSRTKTEDVGAEAPAERGTRARGSAKRSA